MGSPNSTNAAGEPNGQSMPVLPACFINWSMTSSSARETNVLDDGAVGSRFDTGECSSLWICSKVNPGSNHRPTLLRQKSGTTYSHAADRMGVERSGGRDLGGVALSGNLLTFFGHR
jgi:hypothetical protein